MVPYSLFFFIGAFACISDLCGNVPFAYAWAQNSATSSTSSGTSGSPSESASGNSTTTTGSGTTSNSTSGSGSGSGSGNFAGNNLYYAAGLSSSEAETLLQGMQQANMKVLRVWLDGQSTGSTKGTTITSYPSLEPNTVGTYDDTVLQLLDTFMITANKYNVKLLISMHSFNALQAGDVYSKQYGGVQGFYTSTEAQTAFDNRLKHVLEHVHTTLNKPWKELSDYIFAFEAENEAMIGIGESFIESHTDWQCDRAQTIKTELGNSSGILVTTGGESYLAESVQDAWLSCEYLDIIAIHAYGTGDFATSGLQSYVSKAKAAGKMLIMEEWGACYYSTSNNDCPQGGVLDSSTRNSNIKTWASQITAAGLSWLYWQAIPNADPHDSYDYEIGIGTDPSWDTLQSAAQAASSAAPAFDFSSYLLG